MPREPLVPLIKLHLVPTGTVCHRPVSVQYAEAQLRSKLKNFDTNCDGRLSKEELRAAFKGIGSSAPAFRAFRALFHADQNDDGCINDDEFELLVKYVKDLNYIVK